MNIHKAEATLAAVVLLTLYLGSPNSQHQFEQITDFLVRGPCYQPGDTSGLLAPSTKMRRSPLSTPHGRPG